MTQEKPRPFHTQEQLREYVLCKFKYLRGNVKKRYTLTHSNKIVFVREFGNTLPVERGQKPMPVIGKIIITDTNDNRLLAKAVHI